MRHARSLRVATAGLALAVLGTGCASPRAALGPSQSPCFQALPPATAAVDHQGRFAGLTLTGTPERFGIPRRLHLRRRSAPTSTTAPVGSSPTTVPRRDVCLVSFKGTFDTSRIPLLAGPATAGHYAIVVVGVHSRRAFLVYLTDSLPAAFKHL